MRAVDTNVLLRLLIGDDPTQVAVAERFTRGGAWVSHVVLAEVIWVLGSVYDLDPLAIALAVEMLLNHQDLTVQDADVVTAALDRFRVKPRVGFADHLVLETARKAGHLPLGTFDREFGKLEGAQRLPAGG